MKTHCAYCKGPPTPTEPGVVGAVGMCVVCGALQHLACALENKGCATCGKDPGILPRLRATPQVPPSNVPGIQTAFAWGAALATLFFVGVAMVIPRVLMIFFP